MAEKNLRNNDRFSYAATSSLVLNQKRSRKGNETETTGEAISLRGSSNLKLGGRAMGGTSKSEALDNLRRARDSARQKLAKLSNGGAVDINLRKTKRTRTTTTSSSSSSSSTNATYMTTRRSGSDRGGARGVDGGSTSSSSVATYRPRTAETRSAFEDLLSTTSHLLPEGTSEELLHAFAEQAMVVLKSDDYINRRQEELAELFNMKELTTDQYNRLTR